MEQLIQNLDIVQYLNVYLILALMGMGFIIKHAFNKFPNKHIPIFLYAISLVYCLLSIDSISKTSIINAILDATISAAIAIGLHTSGKNIIKTYLSSNKTNEIIDTILDDEEDEEVPEEEE